MATTTTKTICTDCKKHLSMGYMANLGKGLRVYCPGCYMKHFPGRSYLDLSEEEKKEIISKAAQAANKEQRELVRQTSSILAIPKKLPNHRGVRLSSTTSGQRELLREYKNKINEIIDYLEVHEKKN
jgi:hypothetical protein